jgi:hypothetical protein
MAINYINDFNIFMGMNFVETIKDNLIIDNEGSPITYKVYMIKSDNSEVLIDNSGSLFWIKYDSDAKIL